MKLSYLIELAHAAKERAYKPLNEGYKSSRISRIDKMFQKHMITNTCYKYGYISPDEETQPALYLMKSPRNLTERLYSCISGYTYDNIFDENVYNACERLLTDSDFYLKKIHGIQEPSIYTSDDSAQAYKELNKQHVSIGKWLRENIDDFSTFKLSDVADDDVDEIPVSMARKPQYAKGLLFWCDEEGRPVYVSHNNTIIMYCIYKSRLQQETIYTPIRADYPDMTDVLQNLKQFIGQKITYQQMYAVARIIIYALIDNGILKAIDCPEVFTEPAVIKNKCGSLSTKNAILDVPYIVSELSPTVICVNTEGFKKNLREDEYVARAEYKIWLEGQKDLYKRKRDEYQRWIGRCKGINEFLEQRQQLDAITEEVFALMDAFSDVITLIVPRTSKRPNYKQYRISGVCDLIEKTQTIMDAAIKMVKLVKTIGDHISITQAKSDIDGTYMIYSKICKHVDTIRLDYMSLARSWFSTKSTLRDDGLITDKDNEVKVVDSILPEEFVDSNFYLRDPMKRW